MTTYRVPYTFVPGTKAKATEVNANFSSVVDLIEETNSNCADKNLSNLSATGKNVIYNLSRSKLLGEIVTSTIPLSDTGLHLLDGSLLDGSGLYGDFVTYIAGLLSDYPNLFCSEATWQTSVTNYGTCGKFVYNATNNTLRLPKISGFIQGTNDTDTIGDLIEAGLPNIEGSITNSDYSLFWTGGTVTASGAFSAGSTNGLCANTATHESGAKQLDFDASDSSSIYGNAETVQPQSIKVLYYIVVSTTKKPETAANLDNVVTELNSKMDTDLSNMNAGSSAKTQIARWLMPDFSQKITTNNTSYTAPADGWVYVNAQAGTVQISINNEVQVYSQSAIMASYNACVYGGFFVQSGDVVSITSSVTTIAYPLFTYYPLKGAN